MVSLVQTHQSTIDSWISSSKVLFVKGNHKGCGKRYFVDELSQQFDLIECKPDKIKDYDNQGISIMYQKKKRKLVVYYLSELDVSKLDTSSSIKIIVIVDTLHIQSKLSKFMKRHLVITLQYTLDQCIDILKEIIDYPTKQMYIDQLNMYECNLHSIIHNSHSTEKQTDDSYDDSLSFLNHPKTKQYTLSNYDRNPGEYSLIGLHLIDHWDKLPLVDKYKQYRSYIDSEPTKLHPDLQKENILYSFTYPHRLLLQYGYEKINYTRYISKSMIHVYLSKLHKKVDIDELYNQIKQFLHSGNSSLFQMYVDTHKIRKKTMKLLLQIYKDVYPLEKQHHTTLCKSIVYHTD